MSAINLPSGVELRGEIKPGYEEILTEEALAFIADLDRTFGARRKELLARREAVPDGVILAIGDRATRRRSQSYVEDSRPSKAPKARRPGPPQ